MTGGGGADNFIRKCIQKTASLILISAVIMGSYFAGNISGINESYAAPTQYDSIRDFKEVGDYFYIAESTTGKTFLSASIREIEHICSISGLYTLEITTPKGMDGRTVVDTQTGGLPGVGTPGQKLSIDVKIVKGSKFTTYGSPSDGVGIKGVIQLAGGHGGYGQWSNGRDWGPGKGGDGYFGGNGGTGGQRNGTTGPAGTGGDGYVGGPGRAYGGNGGNGYIPGVGASGYGTTVSNGVAGTTYPMSSEYPLNQAVDGTVQYRTGGAFPAFTTTPNTGTEAIIKITLKQKMPELALSDGIIQVELTQTTAYEAQMSMAESLKKIANNREQSPVTMNVVGGKRFDFYTKGYSDTVGGTSEGVTVVNTDMTDDYIQVTGIINDSGPKEIIIDNRKYIFNVLTEPDSSNVTIIFN